jgi:hypothetical protein
MQIAADVALVCGPWNYIGERDVSAIDGVAEKSVSIEKVL